MPSCASDLVDGWWRRCDKLTDSLQGFYSNCTLHYREVPTILQGTIVKKFIFYIVKGRKLIYDVVTYRK